MMLNRPRLLPVVLALMLMLMLTSCGRGLIGGRLIQPPSAQTPQIVPRRTGGLLSIPKSVGKLIGDVVLGKKADTPLPDYGPPATPLAPDVGLGMFTFTGGSAMLAFFVMLILERRPRMVLFLAALALGLIPWGVHMIEPAASWLVGIAATIVAVGLCLWAVKRGLQYRRGQRKQKKKPHTSNTLRRSSNTLRRSSNTLRRSN
jgi:hypothetical protein